MKTLWTRKLKTGAYEALEYEVITGYTREWRHVFDSLEELGDYAKRNNLQMQDMGKGR